MKAPIQVGPFRCHRLEVGGQRTVEATALFSSCAPEIVAAGLKQFKPEQDTRLTIARNCFLIEVDNLTILIDPAGDMDAPGGEPLIKQLGAINKEAADIDIVLVTHVHEDRVAGIVEADPVNSAPVFARARHLIHADEIAFLYSSLATQPEGRYARLYSEAIAPVERAGLLEIVHHSHLVWVHDDAALIIEHAPGHTAGHYVVRATAGPQTIRFTSDTFHHPVQLLDPRISTAGDLDSELALKTRWDMAKRCERAGTLVFGCHFPGTGVGMLKVASGQRTFVPVGTN